MLALLSNTFEITNCDFEDMADIKVKIEDGELVTNSDQMVVVDNIESLIKVIRGQQVMLDKDIAKLYGVEVKVLNQAVKRNVERFPSDFRFQLTKEDCLRSQIVTLNENKVSTLSICLLPLQSRAWRCLAVSSVPKQPLRSISKSCGPLSPCAIS